MSVDVQLDVFSVQGDMGGKPCVAQVYRSKVNYRRPLAKSGMVMLCHSR